MSYYVYILKLTKGKYYVGKTTDIKARLAGHNSGYGSEWTRKYKPIDIVDILTKCDAYDEDKYTLQYIKKYGVDNVRGGSFSSIELSASTREIIEHMIRGAEDRCFKCGIPGHFAARCSIKNGHKAA